MLCGKTQHQFSIVRLPQSDSNVETEIATFRKRRSTHTQLYRNTNRQHQLLPTMNVKKLNSLKQCLTATRPISHN